MLDDWWNRSRRIKHCIRHVCYRRHFDLCYGKHQYYSLKSYIIYQSHDSLQGKSTMMIHQYNTISIPTLILCAISCNFFHNDNVAANTFIPIAGDRSIFFNEMVDNLIYHATNTNRIDPIYDYGYTFQDIASIVRHLHFRDCSVHHPDNELVNGAHCNLCVTPEEILEWYGYNASNINNLSLSKQDFLRITTGLIYILSEPGNIETLDYKTAGFACTGHKTIIFNSVRAEDETDEVFNLYYKKYGGEGGLLTGRTIDRILHRINKTYEPVEWLTNSPCFTPRDIHVSIAASSRGFDKKYMDYFSVLVAINIIQRKCFADAKLSKEYFITALFTKFGNGTHMTHEQFDTVYKAFLTPYYEQAGHFDYHDSHGHGSHRRRRRAAGHDHGDHDDHGDESTEVQTTETEGPCFSAEQLLDIFGVSRNEPLNKADFLEIGASILEQIESNACDTKRVLSHVEKETRTWLLWLLSMAAITLINASSLLVVFALPEKRKTYYPYVMLFLIALGVSVLVCDASLHLFPHAIGLHAEHAPGGTGHESSEAHSPSFDDASYLWKCGAMVLGVFVLSVFEIVLVAYKDDKLQSSGSITSVAPRMGLRRSNASATANGLSRYDVKYSPAAPGDVGSGGVVIVDNGVVIVDNNTIVDEDQNEHPNENIENQPGPVGSVGLSGFKVNASSLKAVIWMIQIGDTVHNFLDGVVIGVAFASAPGLHGGMSTTFAVLLHELPHELSDFSVLIVSGLSVKQSLFLNFLSSLAAYLGAVFGLLLGTKWNASIVWAFALTSGLFLYIALVNMLPELMSMPLLKERPLFAIAIDVFGLLLGFVFMFMLAAWEETFHNIF